MTEARRRGGRGGLLLACVLAALLVLGGVWLIKQGSTEQPAPAMPLPSQPFSLQPSAPASGPVTNGPGTGEPKVSNPSGDPTSSTGQSAVPVPATGKPSPNFPSPNTLYIPSLGVVAPLVPEQAHGGALVIPGDPTTVGLYSGGPGINAKVGTTLLAGHVNYNTTAGALLPLSTIQPHALIVTTDAQGRAWPWTAITLEARDKDDLPPFPADGPRRVVVVTCGGEVIHTAQGRHYTKNVLVTAVPA